MSDDKRKKLVPRPSIMVRKYARQIRFSVIGVSLVLLMFFMSKSFISVNEFDQGSDGVALSKGASSGSLGEKTAGLEDSKINTGNEMSSGSRVGGAKVSKRPADYMMPFTDESQKVIHPEDDGIKEKATMVTLVRNKSLWELVLSIRHVEDRFNRKYNYDWVFLNDEEFTDEFKRVTTALCSGKTKYGLIPTEQWNVPKWIKRDKVREGMIALEKEDILYADSMPYRHMCRYHSGFFFRHPLLEEYDYYWRVDHDITIYCDIQYDIFKFLRVNKKKIGFILSLTDYEPTIKTLWSTVKSFFKDYPQHYNKNNLIKYISDDGGETYNRCHFWSNFEVGDLNFLRSKAYLDYFDYLDKAGGFYYERWGDAPVHSVAAATMMDASEIHFFDGLGFHHPNYFACPVEQRIRDQNKCVCEPKIDDTWKDNYFCNKKYFKAANLMIPLEAQTKTW